MCAQNVSIIQSSSDLQLLLAARLVFSSRVASCNSCVDQDQDADSNEQESGVHVAELSCFAVVAEVDDHACHCQHAELRHEVQTAANLAGSLTTRGYLQCTGVSILCILAPLITCGQRRAVYHS